MKSLQINMPEDTTTELLIKKIQELNQDEEIHGILLQHPVPDGVDERAAFEAIAIEKDVDGVTALGFAQNSFDYAAFPSCTPKAIMTLIDHYDIQVEGQHAVVVGRSPILGKPISMMLLNRNATVTICHSKTKDLQQHLKSADIVVAAVGIPAFIQGEWLKEGAVVLDAGYNEGNIGDVNYNSCFNKSSAITPVPGGVGPVTIATLLKHTIDSAERSLG